MSLSMPVGPYNPQDFKELGQLINYNPEIFTSFQDDQLMSPPGLYSKKKIVDDLNLFARSINFTLPFDNSDPNFTLKVEGAVREIAERVNSLQQIFLFRVAEAIVRVAEAIVSNNKAYTPFSRGFGVDKMIEQLKQEGYFTDVRVSLNLKKQKIRHVDFRGIFQTMNFLQTLDLRFNRIEFLRGNWLPNTLRVLQLTGNRLKEIYGSLPQSLETLDLKNNKLTAIPPCVYGLQKLKILNLLENELQGQIPAELGKLTTLNCLALSKNKFVGIIPSELTRLSRLRLLNLEHNNLDLAGTPEETISDIRAILDKSSQNGKVLFSWFGLEPQNLVSSKGIVDHQKEEGGGGGAGV